VENSSSFGSARAMRRAVVVGVAVLAWVACGSQDPSGTAGGRQPTYNPGGVGAGAPGAGAAGTGSGFGNPNGGGATAGAGGVDPTTLETCADAKVHTNTAEPDILFVVDGSGSMCEVFGNATRWSALRSALLDPTMGLIFRLQQTVDFGLLLYDGTIDLLLAAGAVGGSPTPACAGMYIQNKGTGDCPQLIQVPIGLNNFAAIDAAFPATELGGSTPTDRAMNTAVDQMIAMKNTDPDAKPHPQYIILATDGQPNDICVGGVGGDGSAQQAGVIAAVDRAAMNNITTFVISLAGNDAALQAHLDQVAMHGDPLNPMAKTFTPMSPQDLVSALAAIVGGAVGCDIFLNGTVKTGLECRGFVKIGTEKLPCCSGGACDNVPMDPPNGWLLKDPSTISLVGETCTNFLTNPDALLTAGFPCDVFVVE